jgi:hypothetical protein
MDYFQTVHIWKPTYDSYLEERKSTFTFDEAHLQGHHCKFWLIKNVLEFQGATPFFSRYECILKF